MTLERIDRWNETGLLRLEGAVSGSIVESIRDRVWTIAAEGQGVRREDPTSWARVRTALMKPAREREGLFDPLFGSTVSTELDSLIGRGRWKPPEAPGGLLMTPPDSEHWRLPHGVWHLDHVAPGWIREGRGAQIFLLLDRCEPEGGATLVATGSHRLVANLDERCERRFEGRSAQVRKALVRSSPWLKDLWRKGSNEKRIERFMKRVTTVDGIPLQVVELVGDPGDVYFMHPWMFHAPSPNAGSRMRMAVTERIWCPVLAESD